MLPAVFEEFEKVYIFLLLFLFSLSLSVGERSTSAKIRGAAALPPPRPPVSTDLSWHHLLCNTLVNTRQCQ